MKNVKKKTVTRRSQTTVTFCLRKKESKQYFFKTLKHEEQGEDLYSAKEKLFGNKDRDRSESPSPEKYASDVSYDELSNSMISRRPSPQFGNFGDKSRSVSPIPKRDTVMTLKLKR
jgi:hypothetical protein